MKYAHLNKENKILGWYDDAIHSEIPNPYIQCSNQKWQEAINRNCNYYNGESKKFEIKDFRTLEQLKSDKKKELKNLREFKINNATLLYKDKQFLGNRDTGKEFLKYKIDLKDAIELGLKPVDTKISWRTNDDTYIDLSIEDLTTLSLMSSDFVAQAFKKQQMIEPLIDECETAEEVKKLDFNELWNQ